MIGWVLKCYSRGIFLVGPRRWDDLMPLPLTTSVWRVPGFNDWDADF